MPKNYPELDDAAKRLDLYRLEPKAALPDEQAVRRKAAAAGFPTLPDDHVDFCCRFGASAFEKRAVLPLPADCPLGDQFWVDILYAIGAKTDWDPVDLFQSTYAGRLPEKMLPIGTDPGGNLLLLGIEDRAGVYVWDHDHRELARGEFDRRVADLRARGIAMRTSTSTRSCCAGSANFRSR